MSETIYEKRGAIYPRGILQVCEDVHSTTVGTGERNPSEQERDIKLLQIVLDTWQECKCPFDVAVRQLVIETLAESQ